MLMISALCVRCLSVNPCRYDMINKQFITGFPLCFSKIHPGESLWIDTFSNQVYFSLLFQLNVSDHIQHYFHYFFILLITFWSKYFSYNSIKYTDSDLHQLYLRVLLIWDILGNVCHMYWPDIYLPLYISILLSLVIIIITVSLSHHYSSPFIILHHYKWLIIMHHHTSLSSIIVNYSLSSIINP